MKRKGKKKTFIDHLKVDVVSSRKSAHLNRIVFPWLSMPTNIAQGML